MSVGALHARQSDQSVSPAPGCSMWCVDVSVWFTARGQDAQAPEASPQDAESREEVEEGSSFPIQYRAVFGRVRSSLVPGWQTCEESRARAEDTRAIGFGFPRSFCLAREVCDTCVNNSSQLCAFALLLRHGLTLDANQEYASSCKLLHRAFASARISLFFKLLAPSKIFELSAVPGVVSGSRSS